MEDPRPQTFPPDLDKVLKSYQTVAMSSLSGPSSARWTLPEGALKKFVTTDGDDHVIRRRELSDSMTALKDAEKITETITSGPPVTKIMLNYSDFPYNASPPFPIQQMPVFTPLDRTTSKQTTTILEGEAISCFTVGGEKRLCLPQILNSVLRDFSLQQINFTCDELHIYCSRCNPEQLEVLKITGILPYSAPSCGLITKTDAERLCNTLGGTCPVPNKNDSEKPNYPTENSFKVYHECFGKCKGLLTPELYENVDGACIVCFECDGMFSPQKFILHSHHIKENRTCHWGFDSENWRNYLHLCKDQIQEEKWQEWLEKIKAKFDFNNLHKRKQSFDENENPKRCKVEGGDLKNTYFAPSWPGYSIQRPSAFRPWSPSILTKDGKLLPDQGTVLVRDGHGISTYLRMGPPVLANPERVVPHTAASNYDSQFAPNVALAPHQAEKRKRQLQAAASSVKGEKLSPPGECPELSPTSRHPDMESSLEREIELVKALLESDALDTQAGRERLLQELARIRVHQEERLQNALQSKKNLQQEVEMMRGADRQRLMEMTETKRQFHHQVDCLRVDYERRLRQTNEKCDRLEQEMRRAHQNPGKQVYELSQDNVQLSAENGILRRRLELERKRNQQQQHHHHQTIERRQQLSGSKESSPEPEGGRSPPTARGEVSSAPQSPKSPQLPTPAAGAVSPTK